jgi:hypothetical protein
MGRYRKKPVTVEALKFTGDNTTEIARFIGDDDPDRYVGAHDAVIIDTLEGPMRADIGDFIIRGTAGEHYPCKPHVFEQTYEPVD